jgi:competence protein ComEC
VLREVPVALVIDGAAARIELEGRLPSDVDTASETEYAGLKVAWRERNIPVRAARPGQRLKLGDGVVLTVLAPSSPPLPGSNDNSIVLRLEHKRVAMLLTGDIEREAEERLARRGAPLQCTVLKVAHHGSKTSTSPLFLRAANPRIAVVSCGRYNSLGILRRRL